LNLQTHTLGTEQPPTGTLTYGAVVEEDSSGVRVSYFPRKAHFFGKIEFRGKFVATSWACQSPKCVKFQRIYIVCINIAVRNIETTFFSKDGGFEGVSKLLTGNL